MGCGDDIPSEPRGREEVSQEDNWGKGFQTYEAASRMAMRWKQGWFVRQTRE